MLKEFWEEEEGFAAVELLLILAVLIVIALIFKDAILKFVQGLMAKIFDDNIGDDFMATPKPPTPTPKP